MADLKITKQLISGFYELSEDGWRWTAPTFSVALNPPNSGANQVLRPAKLTVELYFPQLEIDQLGPITLTAISDGQVFGTTTYTRGGSYLFAASVPAKALCTNVLPVTFQLNKFIPASKADPRDLGTVVTSIHLTSVQPK